MWRGPPRVTWHHRCVAGCPCVAHQLPTTGHPQEMAFVAAGEDVVHVIGQADFRRFGARQRVPLGHGVAAGNPGALAVAFPEGAADAVGLRQRRSEMAEAGDFPKSRRGAVVASRRRSHRQPAVGAERDLDAIAFVPDRRQQALTGRHAPQEGARIFTAGQQHAAIGAELHVPDDMVCAHLGAV